MPFYISIKRNIEIGERYLDAAFDSDANLERAVKVLSAGLSIPFPSPGQAARAYNDRGLALLLLDRPQEAVDDFTRALSGGMKHQNVYQSRATAHLQAGNPDQALEDITRAIELAPGNNGLYEHKAGIFNDTGRYNDAIDLAMEVMSQYGWLRTPGMLSARAFAHLKLGNYKESIKDEQQAVRWDTNDAHASVQIGYAYEVSGSNRRAKKHYEHGLKILERIQSDQWTKLDYIDAISASFGLQELTGKPNSLEQYESEALQKGFITQPELISLKNTGAIPKSF
ncbi:MAG: tetratricopeptide repeat protein [Nanoarchaeota archaeon]|nr:tetratricopeptide repeat protein [Nanoarchaeota archaeon]